MAKAQPPRERVKEMRKRRRQAGLVRVEVSVPVSHVNAVKAYAAQLREGSRSERLEEVRRLIAKAYNKYHARYLDNIDVKPESANFGDAAVVAAALIHRGNAEAYRLGQQINRLAK